MNVVYNEYQDRDSAENDRLGGWQKIKNNKRCSGPYRKRARPAVQNGIYRRRNKQYPF